MNLNLFEKPMFIQVSAVTWRWCMIAVLFLQVLFVAAESQAAVTVTPTSGSVIYTDTTNTAPDIPSCSYKSFNVTSSAAVVDAWITMGNFTGGFLSLGGSDNGLYHVGSLAANQTKAVYFYVCSSYAIIGTSTPQNYDIKLYDGRPYAGGTQVGSNTLATTINNRVITSSSNQVNVIVSGPNPATIGGIITMTVNGDTGSIGCVNPPSTCTTGSGPLSFTPATFSNWRADAYEMVASNITLSGGNSGSYDNLLYIDNVASSSPTHYVATFYFRALGATGTTTSLSPVSYLASGSNIKHTNLTNGAYSPGSLSPILSSQASVVLAKAVSHATLPAQGGRVTYTVTAFNSGLDDVSLDSFIDVLPAGATYVSGSTTFNGAAFPNPGVSGQTLTWSSIFVIPASTSRRLVFQADLPATPDTYSNTVSARIGTVIIDSTLQTTDNVPASATTIVLKAPTITKAFLPNSLAVNRTSTMVLTITNLNSGQSLSGISVSDTLPSSPFGLVFASPSAEATTCSGAILTLAGSTFSINGGTLAAGQSCTATVNVTSASVNTTYTNTTNTVSSTNGGTGTTASATVTFTAKPTISKSFSVASIPRNGTATMTLSITNNASMPITGMTFDDLFPAGMVTVNPPAVSPASPCGGALNSWNGVTTGALSASGGDSGIRLSGSTLASPGSSCSFTINVTSATAGSYTNTTGGVTSNETSPAGPSSNTALLAVLAPPTAAKAFSPATIGKGQSSTLTITLSNPNAIDISGTSFTDTYPANLNTAATPNAATTCPGGTVSSTTGSVSLSGGSIPAAGSCTVSIDVTSSVVASYTNTLAAGAVTTANAGSNPSPASAGLTVDATPTISKSFVFNTSTGVSTMNITILNNNTAAISGLSFTDLFPSGMQTDNPPSVSPATPCGAGSTLQSWDGTTAGTLSATGGNPGIRLNAGQIATAGGSCTFSINMAVNSLGVYANQTSGVTLTGPFSGTGSLSNSAVWISPAISKTLTTNSVGPGDISRLEIRITNPSPTTPLTGLALIDTYPTTATQPDGTSLVTAAMTNSATPNATSSCGGSVTANAGGTGISLTGGSLPAGGVCTISVDVRGTTAPSIQGSYALYNKTGRVGSNEGIGSTGSDVLNIVNKPTITKSFLTSPVTLSGGTATSLLRIIVKNNSSAGVNITNVSFSDTFPSSPSQMRWVNTVANSCGGTLSDTGGAALVANTSTGIKLTGGAIVSAATCTIDVTVSVSATGSYSNTAGGATSSVNSSPGTPSNTAILTAYLSAPTVGMSFANAAFQVNGSNNLTITITNPNTTAIAGTSFTDSYPANLANAAVPNLTSSCGGTVTAAPGTGTLSLSGGIIPASGSCSIAVDVTAATIGTFVDTLNVNAITSSNANTAPASAVSATADVYTPPTVTKNFAPATISVGGTSVMTITVINPAVNLANLTGVSISDAYAGTLKNNPAGSVACSGAGSATLTGGVNSGTTVGFNTGTIVPGGSCTITQSVTATATVSNTTGVPTTTGPAVLTGTAAGPVTLTMFALPSLTFVKSAVPASAAPGQAITYLLLTTNSGPGIANSLLLSDTLGSYIFWGLDSFGSGTPFLLTQGAPASGVTLGTPAYSSDNGATWTYTPVSSGGGAPSGFDGMVTNWRIPMSGDMNGNGANFILQYKVQVR